MLRGDLLPRSSLVLQLMVMSSVVMCTHAILMLQSALTPSFASQQHGSLAKAALTLPATPSTASSLYVSLECVVAPHAGQAVGY